MHRRTVAALLAGAMLTYWFRAGRPLVGVGVASLVLAGERVSAAGFTLSGRFSWPLTAAGGAVALGTLWYGVAAGLPVAGVVVAALVLLTTWLSEPTTAEWRPWTLVTAPSADSTAPEE